MIVYDDMTFSPLVGIGLDHTASQPAAYKYLPARKKGDGWREGESEVEEEERGK